MRPPKILLRAEEPGDAPAIADVHRASFDTDAESGIVDLLRERGELAVSIVAEHGRRIVGHVAISPVEIDAAPGDIKAGGVGPIAVLPRFQGQLIGTALMVAAIDAARLAGFDLLVVLGEPAYYARFGFLRASDIGLQNEYGADEAFRAHELSPGAFACVKGLVRYSPAFAGG